MTQKPIKKQMNIHLPQEIYSLIKLTALQNDITIQELIIKIVQEKLQEKKD